MGSEADDTCPTRYIRVLARRCAVGFFSHICRNEYLEKIAYSGGSITKEDIMEEVFERFNQAGIRYLLIGGQAMRLEGMPRFSMDWDVYLPGKDEANIAAINQVLKDELDLPLVKLGVDGSGFIQTYQTRWGILQFHLAGPGLTPFDQADSRCVVHETDKGVKVRCLAPQDLLAAKQAADRPQDQDDILFLKARLGLSEE